MSPIKRRLRTTPFQRLRKAAPHKALSYWPGTADFPQSGIDDQWPEELVGSIGNLFFLESVDNCELDAKSPEQKREILKKSGAAIPKFIAKQGKWSPEKIRAHTDELAAIAKNKIWKI